MAAHSLESPINCRHGEGMTFADVIFIVVSIFWAILAFWFFLGEVNVFAAIILSPVYAIVGGSLSFYLVKFMIFMGHSLPGMLLGVLGVNFAIAVLSIEVIKYLDDPGAYHARNIQNPRASQARNIQNQGDYQVRNIQNQRAVPRRNQGRGQVVPPAQPNNNHPPDVPGRGRPIPRNPRR